MGLTLSETQTIQEIANYLYSFLPGQPHPFADKKISFTGIAYELGLGNFWQSGSKLPAITSLLENALEFKRDVFCKLILEIVRRGIKYRDSKGHPITHDEIDVLNKIILKVKFKIPELWDTKFLDSLPSLKQPERAKEEQEEEIKQEKRSELIEKLQTTEKLLPQKRGFAFEEFLNEIFDVFKFNPHRPFKLTGEQIDGSLELDGETYLIEAKWEKQQIGLEDLLCFSGKVQGKATWSRGIFISYTGFTKDALIAFSKGRPTNLITLTAQDLYFVLNGNQGVYLNLDEVIRIKLRYAAETGNIGVSVYELLINKGK